MNAAFSSIPSPPSPSTFEFTSRHPSMTRRLDSLKQAISDVLNKSKRSMHSDGPAPAEQESRHHAAYKRTFKHRPSFVKKSSTRQGTAISMESSSSSPYNENPPMYSILDPSDRLVVSHPPPPSLSSSTSSFQNDLNSRPVVGAPPLNSNTPMSRRTTSLRMPERLSRNRSVGLPPRVARMPGAFPQRSHSMRQRVYTVSLEDLDNDNPWLREQTSVTSHDAEIARALQLQYQRDYEMEQRAMRRSSSRLKGTSHRESRRVRSQPIISAHITIQRRTRERK